MTVINSNIEQPHQDSSNIMDVNMGEAASRVAKGATSRSSGHRIGAYMSGGLYYDSRCGAREAEGGYLTNMESWNSVDVVIEVA